MWDKRADTAKTEFIDFPTVVHQDIIFGYIFNQELSRNDLLFLNASWWNTNSMIFWKKDTTFFVVWMSDQIVFKGECKTNFNKAMIAPASLPPPFWYF